MDPMSKYGGTPFNKAILYEHSIGDPSTRHADYRSYARGKG